MTIQPISGFADPTLDPFALWEATIGMAEVEDPHPRLAALRREGGVHAGEPRELFGLPRSPLWTDTPCFTVVGYEEALQVLSDTQNFSNSILARQYAIGFGARALHGMDPPEHTRYRRLFQQAFLPKHIAAWRDQLLPGVVHGFLDRLEGRKGAELIGDFVKDFPFHFIFGQLDLPREDQQTFHGLAIALLCTMRPDVMSEASQHLGRYLAALIEARRRAPGDDLISNLARVELDGDVLPVEVIVDFLRQLLAAGGGTTFHATGNMLVGLLTHPDQWAAVVADNALVPRGVAEALRWDAPSMTANRKALRAMRLGGLDIPGGARLTVMLGAINRDPLLTGGGDDYDLFRDEPDRPLSLSFSYGPHVCIGRHLAQMEMAVALEAMVGRFPQLRLDPEAPVPRVRGLVTRTPDAIRVRLD